MPDASKAPEPKPAPEPESDPVEERRMRMAVKRNKGMNKDVNLPAERY